MAYAAGWKKFEPLWDFVIKTRRVCRLLPVLESVLSGFGRHPAEETASASTEQAAGELDVA